MGCELAIACIPCAKMTPNRIQTLHALVDGLDDEELEFDNVSMHSDDHNNEELRSILHEKVELIAVAEDHWRDVNHIWFPDFPYTLLATGGYTFGESPSHLYEAFCIVEECETLLKQLADWAREDADVTAD